MKYGIYQINITREDADEINSMENPRANHPKFKAQTHAQFEEWDEVDFEFYEHVANIEANDLEHVFMISNQPYDREECEARIERLERMHSVSVGDIIMTDDGSCYGVEGYGFKELVNFGHKETV